MPTSSRTAKRQTVRTTAIVQFWRFSQRADVGIGPYECDDGACGIGKGRRARFVFLRYVQKILEKIMKKAKIMLDIHGSVYYNKRARVWDKTARTAMMQEIASKDGNFCGVCPVIGRLSCFCLALRISLRQEKGRPCVGHFSWHRMIRTVALTSDSTVPRHQEN